MRRASVRGDDRPWLVFALRRTLLTVYRKGQEHVTRLSAGRVIARVEEDHPAADRRPRTIDRSPTRFDAVDRLVGALRVVITQHLAIRRRIRAHMAVDGSG